MSDPNGVNTPSPGEQSVPLSRLNEEIQKAREAKAEADMLKQLLQRAVPQAQPQARPEQEPAWLKKMKEENPDQYRIEKAREFEMKQLRAHAFMQNDQTDRIQFQMSFGKKAEQYGEQVEQQLNSLRAQGVHSYNRANILKNILADELLRKESMPQTQSAAAPTQTNDAPPTDPKSAAPISQSSAPAKTGAQTKTVEQWEAELADKEF